VLKTAEKGGKSFDGEGGEESACPKEGNRNSKWSTESGDSTMGRKKGLTGERRTYRVEVSRRRKWWG